MKGTHLRNWTGNLHLRRAIFLAALVYGTTAESPVAAQSLEVRTGRGPHFVGNPIAIQVVASGFDTVPEIQFGESNGKNLRIENQGSQTRQSTRIYQSGGKRVRETVSEIIFQYGLEFDLPGTYRVGPFESTNNGKKVSSPAIAFEVLDVEIDKGMQIEINFPKTPLYPGQNVPLQLVWRYSGQIENVTGLVIRSPLFRDFRFADTPVQGRQGGIPIATRDGIQSFAAEFKQRNVDGQTVVEAVVNRILQADSPGKFSLPATRATFKMATGWERSGDPFDLLGRKRVFRPMKAVGSPVNFEIRPFPKTGRPKGFSGTVGSGFEIATSLNRTRVRSGDPLTLQVDIRGQGNIRAISLPNLKTFFPATAFDVPDEMAAGVHEGDRKQFQVPIRIRQQNVAEIPPIEFSWFDPQQQAYRTARSQPIPVEVSAGKMVTSNEVIRNAGTTGPGPGNKAQQLTEGLDLSIETSVDHLLGEPESTFTWQVICYLSGIGAIVLSWFGVHRQYSSQRGTSRRQVLYGKCRTLCSMEMSAGLEDRLAAGLRSLQALLSEPEIDLPQAETTREEIDQLIGKCDSISFRPDPSTTPEQAELLEEVRAICKELQKR